jgi:hypothetical protein
MRALAISSDMLYAEHDQAILGLSTQVLGDSRIEIILPGQSFLSRTRLVMRLLRLGVHALCQVADGVLVMGTRHKVIRYDPAARRFSHSFDIPNGRRFLFLSIGPCNDLHFGEYFGNEERETVHIYRSADGGCKFEVVRTFTAKGIRHIHGVFHDPYTGALWVTTGDTDQESGIWVTEDGFRTFERVLGGSQQTRAIQLLFTQQHVYFGSDTPLERNYIYRLEKKSGRVERLQEVESSVFWGCKVNEFLFFSTTVEPSAVNTSRHAWIWGSKDGGRWKKIVGFHKDIWPMKLFQYGQIFFPSGENNTGYLFFTPFATEKHYTIQRLKVTDLFES